MHTLHVFKWIDSFRLYNSVMDLNKIGDILLTILRESFTSDQKASPTTFRNPSRIQIHDPEIWFSVAVLVYRNSSRSS